MATPTPTKQGNTQNKPANYYSYAPANPMPSANNIAALQNQFAQSQWDTAKTYAPQQAASAFKTQSEYAPQLGALAQGIQQTAIPGLAETLSTATSNTAAHQAALSTRLNQKYAPRNTALMSGLIDQADPYFNAVRGQLGANTFKGLQDGYNLGDELSNQVNQQSRAAQTARGNWYGPAPTADEAFNNAQARINLYNTRMSQGSQFLQDRGAGDLFSQYSQTLPYAPSQVMPTTNNIVGQAAQGANVDAQLGMNGSAQYTQSLLQPINTNFQTAAALAQGNTNYQNQFDNYLYNTSVANGLYNTYQPNAGNGAMGGLLGMGVGAGLGGIAGGALAGTAIMPGVGTVAGALAGAALGGGLGGAVGTGIGQSR